MDKYNLVSFAGLLILPAFAWLLSTNRRAVNPRLVIGGMSLQLFLAAFVFLFPPGVKIFMWLNDAVVLVMQSASAGAEFVFGPLALPPGTVSETGATSLGFILAFQGLPTIIFFSALVAILYHYGVMQFMIRMFARLFTKVMRISGAESLCAASNIFCGVESSLTIRPHLESMTRSELTTVLTAGMATVASNVLALYVFSLRGTFPTIAAHLISASILSAPAAVIMSKIMVPETESPKTLGTNTRIHFKREKNIIEAIIKGANDAVKLIFGIVALLTAVLGLVALADLILGGIGGIINNAAGFEYEWSLSGIIGILFHPVALVLGIPPSDAAEAARIIGSRTIVTEVTAYQDLAKAIESGVFSHGRTQVICAYALCGFAHIASLAIFIGGITAIAPKTTSVLSRVGLRALIASTLACLMTACVAGVFYTHGSILFGG